MIEWASVAAIAVSILASFIKGVGEKTAEKTADAISNLLKSKFKGDKEANSVFNNFKKKPERYESALADIIKEKAKKDKTFGDELNSLIIQGTSSNSSINNIQTANGKNIAQASGNNTNASVSVNRDTK